MARPHGTSHPFFFFFSDTKTETKITLTVKFDWKNCEWQVPIGRFWLPSCVFSSFFLFSPLCFFLFHRHTRVKFVADRFSPSPNNATDIQKATLIITICSHTFVCLFFLSFLFLSNNIKEEQGKMIHTQREREKKKKTDKKKRNTNICALLWPSTNGKKDRHWIQKYHNFSISNRLCWLLFRNTLVSREPVKPREFLTFWFVFFCVCVVVVDYNLQFQLSNARCIHCKYDLSLAVQRFLTNLPFFFFFFFSFYSPSFSSHYKTTLLFTYFQV